MTSRSKSGPPAMQNGEHSERLWQAVLYATLAVAVIVAIGALDAHAATAPGAAFITHERPHGYLGVEFHDTPEEQIAALHLQGAHGAEIVMVDHDGPAGKAGLQPHDVVLQMDNQNIDNAEDLTRRIRESAPGRVISLSIMRLGRMLTLTAKLANREELEHNTWQQRMAMREPPPPDDGVDNILIERYMTEPAPAARAPSRSQSFIGTVLRSGPYTGASLEAMEPQLAMYFGAPANSGLLVQAVDNNSPAAAAGLHAGDVVLRVDAMPVASPSDWMKRIRAGKGRAVTLTVLRERHEQTLTLLPDLKRHSLLEWPSFF